MLTIDTQSGKVQWGDIECHPQLKINEFDESYPHIRRTSHEDGRGLWRSEIPLERLPINRQLWNARIAYENQFLRRIEFTAGSLTRHIPESQWWQYHLHWMVSVKGWLLPNIGKPEIVDPVQLYEGHRALNQLENKVLETWQYTYEWGNITFFYESIEGRSSLSLNYNNESQIRDWNDLIQVCNWAIRRSQIEKKSTTNLTLIRDTITLIGKHLKFEEMTPKISSTGLIFWSSIHKTYVDVDIWRGSSGKNYRIYRRDTATEIRVSIEGELVAALRDVLEIE